MYQSSTRRLATALLAGVASAAIAGTALAAEEKVAFDITVQPLGEALRLYALQSDQEILFSPESVANLRSARVHGVLEPAEALNRLLAPSGLRYQVTDQRTILVQAQPTADEETAPAGPGGGESSAGDGGDRAAAAPRGRDSEEMDRIVVLGTQIRGSSVTDTLPVTVINADDIAATGAVSGDELFRSIPQFGDVGYNEEGTTVGGVNSARGDVASINLRSIGTGNTLTLLNGRRMVLHPGVQVENLVPVTTVNSNAIPVTGVRRVEVLRDGAAAIYGADAVAGVVNILLKDDFEGLRGDVQYGVAEGTNQEQFSMSAEGGHSFNNDRTNISVFANYTTRTPMYSSDRDYSRSQDLRPLVEGTEFEGDTNFDNRTSNTPWGYFDPIGYSTPITQFGTQISDNDADIHIEPLGSSRCKAHYGDVCIASGSIPRDLRYNSNHDRWLSGEVDRVNVFTFINHDFNESVSFFGEAGYYYADYYTEREQGSALSSSPITVPSYNYYNPLGPVMFDDGRINPNRLPGLNIPVDGLDLDLDLYRLIDVGPRQINVENSSYRLLGGLRGNWRGWDWESAVLYSEAKTDDTTSNRVSSTLFQQALMLDTPDAYNPFNGGDPDNINEGDTTFSNQATVDSFLIDVSRVSRTSLRIIDARVSRPDLFELPGGSVGFAFGAEHRRETYEDDRDPRLDGTITFTNPITGDFSGSDVLGSSPTPDSEGDRDVWAAYAETVIPVISPEMEIPLVHRVQVQAAGRFEHYDSFGDVWKPKVAAAWYPAPWLQFRGAWSLGFRAPNLPQLFQEGGERVNTREDYIFCEADLRAGRITDFNDCDRSQAVVSDRAGSQELGPENSTHYSAGTVFQSDIGTRGGRITLTVDYWRIEQEGVVGIFGDSNQIAYDYLLRVLGSSSPNVERAAPTAQDIADFAGTGLDPVGEIIRVDDNYMNLLARTGEGIDIVAYYSLDDTPIGDFDLTVNAAYLLTFDQEPSPEAEALLAAQADGIIDDVFPVIGVNDLIGENGVPEWRGAVSLTWRMGPWGAGFYGSYIGSVYDTSAISSQGNFWEIDDWFTANLYLQYTFDAADYPGVLADTRLRVGVRNIADTDPPLADSGAGYLGDLHSARGRFIYGSISKTF